MILFVNQIIDCLTDSWASLMLTKLNSIYPFFKFYYLYYLFIILDARSLLVFRFD